LGRTFGRSAFTKRERKLWKTFKQSNSKTEWKTLKLILNLQTIIPKSITIKPNASLSASPISISPTKRGNRGGDVVCRERERDRKRKREGLTVVCRQRETKSWRGIRESSELERWEEEAAGKEGEREKESQKTGEKIK
jgi:hypothetical protein